MLRFSTAAACAVSLNPMAGQIPAAATPVSELPLEYQELFRTAVLAAQKAYCPYSNFEVGCAIRTRCGRVFVGCNVENAAYSPGICAERSAIASAVSAGYRLFDTIAVFGHSRLPTAESAGASCSSDARAAHRESLPSPVTAPCGVCRQTLYEFQCVGGTHPITMILGDHSGKRAMVVPLKALLPLAFGPSDLNIDVADHKCVD